MRIGAGVLLATMLSASPAFAGPGDVQQCVASSEKGQRARAAGKLREARESFLACATEHCPGLIRKDCNQWRDEISSALPTVVFGAHDKSGKDLFEVTVTMDNEVLTTKLDGKSVAVDPGPHTFKFETAGLPAVTERLLVKEGEKSRVLNATFDVGGGGMQSNPRNDPPVIPERSGGHTPYPWIVVGVGAVGMAVGVVVVLTTPERPANCSKETETCTRTGSQTAEDLRSDQEQAGRADSQPVLGWGIFAAATVVLAGGLVWHFLEPTGESRTSIRARPWTSAHGGGLAIDGTF